MEDTFTEDDSMLDLYVDPAAADYMESAGWWAKFSSVVIAILLLIVIGIVGYVYYLGMGSAISMNFPTGNLSSFIWLLLVLIVGFCGLMIGLLVHFAIRVRNGIEQSDHDQLEHGFNSLKLYFIIYGIFSMLGAVGAIVALVK